MDWTLRATRPKREILAPTDQDAHPIASATHAPLVAAIARGVQMIISLAFLSPNIVQAAIDGVLPRRILVTRLFDLPMEWRLQHKLLEID